MTSASFLAPRVRHTRFVKTPLIADTLHLQAYQRGQWVRFAWCDKPSRFFGMNPRGNVTAFHHPKAHSAFVSYCVAGRIAELKREGRSLVAVGL